MDNKATIIAVCAALLLLTLVFACSKGCSTQPSTSGKKAFPTSSKTQTTTTKDEHQYDDFRPSGSSAGSGHSGSYYEESSEDDKIPPSLISREQMKEMIKAREIEDEKLRESAANWIAERLKDPTLSAKTREQFLLRANQNFNNAMHAAKRKDYTTAIKEFNAILKDEKASAVTKYFALYNLAIVAQNMKDLDLFFVATRMKAKLVANEDLTILNIHKNYDQLIWCNKVEYALKAQESPQYMDEAIKAKIDEHGGEITREAAQKFVEKDIVYYRKLFKDFYE